MFEFWSVFYVHQQFNDMFWLLKFNIICKMYRFLVGESNNCPNTKPNLHFSWFPTTKCPNLNNSTVIKPRVALRQVVHICFCIAFLSYLIWHSYKPRKRWEMVWTSTICMCGIDIIWLCMVYILMWSLIIYVYNIAICVHPL